MQVMSASVVNSKYLLGKADANTGSAYNTKTF